MNAPLDWKVETVYPCSRESISSLKEILVLARKVLRIQLVLSYANAPNAGRT